MNIKLPPEFAANIDAQLRHLHDLLPEFDKATACGIECEQFKKEHAEEVRLLTALKTHYT